MDVRPQKQTREPATNGAKPDEKALKPAATSMAAIDLTVDLSALKYDKTNDDGAPSLLMYRNALEIALESFEAMQEKFTAVNQEIGKRLHKNKIGTVRIHEGKNVAMDAKVGEVFRVRAINGSDPPVYQLYSQKPKKAKDGSAPVDISDL